jgi:hypothetical protein
MPEKKCVWFAYLCCQRFVPRTSATVLADLSCHLQGVGCCPPQTPGETVLCHHEF